MNSPTLHPYTVPKRLHNTLRCGARHLDLVPLELAFIEPACAGACHDSCVLCALVQSLCTVTDVQTKRWSLRVLPSCMFLRV